MSPIEKVKSALRRLQLSEHQQQVYLSLLTEGQATARVLAARTGITRPSVYDQLKSLRALGLVVELDIENKTHFAAADIEQLDALLADQIDRIEQSRDFLQSALPSLLESTQTVSPKIRFFEGEDSMKQLLKDVMWHDNTTLQILWVTQAMNEQFDEKFLKWFDERRLKRNLGAAVLYSGVRPKIFKDPEDVLAPLPKNSFSKMSSIIFDNKVAYVSSGAESFGFIVESKEFATLQRTQFQKLFDA